MADPITAYLTNLGFPQIMLWLLSFAALYGLMSQAGVPKDKASRAIISIVAAFFVILAAPAALISVLEKMAQSLILVVLGILVFIVFLEVAGVTVFEKVVEEKEGKKSEKLVPVKVLHKYGKHFAAFFIILAILIFIGAGGLNLLGISVAVGGMPTMSILFFVIVVAAIMWMIFEKE
ncbi:MAG: hypothetical protein QXU82_01520 [Candidatus Aenigmatarchaeota archaeon]